MGIKVFPIHAIIAMLYSETFLKGSPKKISNPLTYDLVRLNCPDTPEYDTCLLWLYVLYHVSIIATILATYVNY